MFLTGFPAAAFGTNCLVIAPAEGEECLIVDPGVGVLDRLEEVLTRHRLRPAAVLLTHGHADHVMSVTPVADPRGIAVHVHADDRYRLRDPFSSMSTELVAMLESSFGRLAWTEPSDVRSLPEVDSLTIAGIEVGLRPAPGHTEGSVMFLLDGVPDATPGTEGMTSTLVAGDVLFAGGIGRTDLPGGSDEAMAASLRDAVLTLPDDVYVLPGHGPATTMYRERRTNPYLLGVTASPSGRAPGDEAR